MASVFKSGAFIQQCFSAHPRCVMLQKLVQPDTVVFTCTSCRLTHTVTVRTMATRVPVALAATEVSGSDERARDHLAQCVAAHPLSVSVREMDVLRDAMGLRCADCRRIYDLEVAAFETHQR